MSGIMIDGIGFISGFIKIKEMMGLEKINDSVM